ncbi:acetate/propionate family kinase [Methylophaga sp.]|uniref:acetate/propionate family kinase n=1 Tax=Methylophaga sp. TaxID=2024840 RepID=UPI00271BD5C8|nr:acetate/propionate family kinase [Methylophaga sp.]MDO8828446.1 acetate/propionate family kinase [Methylophaga sp.]
MPQDKTYLLTINGGSSSIKFTLYNVTESLVPVLSGKLTGLGLPTASLRVKNPIQAEESAFDVKADNYRQAVTVLVEWFQDNLDISSVNAIGHRIVHGGHLYKKPQWVTQDLLNHLSAITPLDPQHLPGEIQLIEAFGQQFPKLKQMVCFDTEFHQNLPVVAKLLPIPRFYYEKGIYRYGFHGLSYRYLMQILHQHIGEKVLQDKIVLAHLGNGASMAAVINGQSIDTTMAMTPAAGLVMGSRSGDLDPGLFGLLNRSEGMTGDQFETMINQQSGLLGISTITSDMQQLLEKCSEDSHARDAVDVFCYQARKQIGAYAAALGGLDTLVFSGGIGENVAEIRALICQDLAFIGIELDNELNQQNALRISTPQSRVTVWVIPTNEELMIAQSMCDQLNLNHQGEK